MLRDQNLIPLSRQHHHALALCVRIDRALQSGEVDLEAWQAEIQQQFEQDITIHFAAEEKDLFPAAARFPDLESLVNDLLSEHTQLRDLFTSATARKLDTTGLQAFASTLSAHIRKEERQLFEEMQKRMSPAQLAALGTELEQALADAPHACLLPSEATRLRAKS